jgi:hypothetical protein
MSDAELVKRLRKLADDMEKHAAPDWDEHEDVASAADSIEALEQQVADLLANVPCACGYDSPTDVCMKHVPLVRNLTAKLAKSVEGLRFYTCTDDGGWTARATLAEIEGEKT